jgi:hypothetical protein
MIGDIRKHLATTPFAPFTIRTADGCEYFVPTIDHIWLPPGSSRIAISDNDGFVSLLLGLMITGIVAPEPAPENGF